MEGYTLEEQIAITKGVMHILDTWGVPGDLQVKILGLPAKTKARQLEQFSNKTPLPNTEEVMQRVTHLVAIVDALRTTYPSNPRAGDMWMKTPHRRFNNQAPLVTIVEDGLLGLEAVRGHLDCTYTF